MPNKKPDRFHPWKRGGIVNAGHHKAYLKRTYGLSESQWFALYRQQDGKCKCCGDEVYIAKMHIDHNHTTGIIRGLLCPNCNHMLGHAKDSPERLQAGIAYLENFPGRLSEQETENSVLGY